MELPGGLGTLCYCLNVHSTQSFDDVQAALTGPAAAVKALVCPDAPFAVGLRLSAEAAAHSDAGRTLAALLAGEGMEAVTVNGFPYGPFHGTPVKAAVYRPDWTTPERVAYTNRLADIVATLVPAGGFASISTVPGGYAADVRGHEAEVAEGLLQTVAHLVRVQRDTGRTVALAVEPEPGCLLETIDDVITFFGDRLYGPSAIRRLMALTGLRELDAALALPRHLGLCLDVCHLAVGFEDPADAVGRLQQAGIPIHKLQLSAALKYATSHSNQLNPLAAFDEPVYLHQTNIRDGAGAVRRFIDLPQALGSGLSGEWRTHFHVPLFADPVPPLATTRDVLETVLALHRQSPLTGHLEVETYTWGVLPAGVLPADIAVTDGIAKEMQWVLRQLAC